MFKMLLCCGGGFSSSAMAKHVQDELIAEGKGEEACIDFSPFSLMPRVIDQYDIIICCPHLQMEMPAFFKKYDVKVPLYILPTRMYGLMKFTEVYEDALDAVQIFKETGMNPVHFPGENNPLTVKRYLSYRKTHGDWHDAENK